MVACLSSVYMIVRSIPSQFKPLQKNACREASGNHAGCQEIDRCSTRGGSQGMYITFASTKANKAEPILDLKPRGDVTRNLRHLYQWPQNRTCVCVRQKTC